MKDDAKDFEKIPDITTNPDTIEAKGKSKRGGEIIAYTKEYDSTYHYHEEIREKRKELATKTMFKRGKKKKN